MFSESIGSNCRKSYLLIPSIFKRSFPKPHTKRLVCLFIFFTELRNLELTYFVRDLIATFLIGLKEYYFLTNKTN